MPLTGEDSKGSIVPNAWKACRVLITGGAGFIGSNLVDRLLELEAKVRVVDDLSRGKLEFLANQTKKIDFWRADLTDPDVCQRACQDIDVLFHLASKVGGIQYYMSKPGEVLIQNCLIDLNVLQAALSAGVGRYLYASSAHVYPIELQLSPDAPLIKEEQAVPAHPELSYGWAKLMGEHQIIYSSPNNPGTRFAIVRLIGVYGPRQDCDVVSGSAIPVFVRRAVEYPKNAPFRILGTGEETRSYCYVEDVCDALIRCVSRLDGESLIGPLNIGNEDRVTIMDLARQIVQISGKKIEIERDPSHPTVIWGQALDCSAARTLLGGWSPRVSLQDGLRDVFADISGRTGW